MTKIWGYARFLLLALGSLMSVSWGSTDILREEETIPTPEMAISIDIGGRSSGWRVKSETQSPMILKTEMMPTIPENFEESINSVVAFGVGLNQYISKWGLSLGLSYTDMVIRNQNSKEIIVTYKTAKEHGIWKFIQGSDGVYALGYTFAPKGAKSEKTKTMVEVVEKSGIRER
jgi:hypothetical protein